MKFFRKIPAPALAMLLLGLSLAAWLPAAFELLYRFTGRPLAVMTAFAASGAAVMVIRRSRKDRGMTAGILAYAAAAAACLWFWGKSTLALAALAAAHSFPGLGAWLLAFLSVFPALYFLSSRLRILKAGHNGCSMPMAAGFGGGSVLLTLFPVSPLVSLALTAALAAGAAMGGRKIAEPGDFPDAGEEPLAGASTWSGMLAGVVFAAAGRLFVLALENSAVPMAACAAAALCLLVFCSRIKPLRPVLAWAPAGLAALLLGIMSLFGYSLSGRIFSMLAAAAPQAIALRLLALLLACLFFLPLLALFGGVAAGNRRAFHAGIFAGLAAGLIFLRILPFQFMLPAAVAVAFALSFWKELRERALPQMQTLAAAAIAFLLVAASALTPFWAPVSAASVLEGGPPNPYRMTSVRSEGEFVYVMGEDYLGQPGILPQGRERGLTKGEIRGLGVASLYLDLLLRRPVHALVIEEHFPDPRTMGIAQNYFNEEVDILCRSGAYPGFGIAAGELESPAANFFTAPKVHLAKGSGVFGLMGLPAGKYDLVLQADAVPGASVDVYHSTHALRLIKKSMTTGGVLQARIDTRYWDPEALLRLIKGYAVTFSNVQLWAFDDFSVHLAASDGPLTVTSELFLAPFQLQDALAGKARMLGVSSGKQILAGYLGNQISMARRHDLHTVPEISSWKLPLRLESRSPLSIAGRDALFGPSLLLDEEPLFLEIAGMGVQVGEEIIFPEMAISAKPSPQWELRKAGLELTTESVRPPSRSARYQFTIAMPDDLLSIALWEERPKEPVPIETLAEHRGLDEKIGTGQGDISGHPLRWALTKDEKKHCFSFAWYCDVNNRFFSGRYLDFVSSGPGWQAMREPVVRQVACIHPPQPSSP
jgi:hypothetical protein